MVAFEFLSWLAFGLFVGLFQVYMRRERRPWPMVLVVAVGGAVLGGLFMKLISSEDEALRQYDLRSLMVAVIVSVALTLFYWGTGRKLESP